MAFNCLNYITYIQKNFENYKTMNKTITASEVKRILISLIIATITQKSGIHFFTFTVSDLKKA